MRLRTASFEGGLTGLGARDEEQEERDEEHGGWAGEGGGRGKTEWEGAKGEMGRRVNGPSSPALEAVFYERPPIAHRFRADQLPFVSFRSGTLPCGSEGVCAGASPRRARTRTPREERRFCQPSRSVSPGDEEVRDVSSKERQVKGSALAATLGRRTSPRPTIARSAGGAPLRAGMRIVWPNPAAAICAEYRSAVSGREARKDGRCASWTYLVPRPESQQCTRPRWLALECGR